MEVPNFKYHPDPIATGSVKPSDAECLCCGQKSDLIYTGPVYAIANLRGCLCPWCIADGTAHAKFDAAFTDSDAIPDVPMSVVEEVAHRTPGFSGWQQERWWTHCGDAGAYLGDAEGFNLNEQQVSELIEAIEPDFFVWSEQDWRKYFEAPGVGTRVSVYVFRCLHCGRIGGYADST
jgi:uncharacterized protein